MAIPLRSDFDAPRVRMAARHSKDAGQVRRLLALERLSKPALQCAQADE